MKASDASGLSRARTTLEAILKAGPLAHAVLLYGPEGCGHVELARELAREWLCGEDEGLRARFDRGALPDFQEVFPKGVGGLVTVDYIVYKKNGPQQEEVVPLVPYFQTRPMAAKHKAMAFHRAHRMNQQSAHKLLKTLEEPPPYAKILLTTSDVSRVLPTIRSRCLMVACDLPEGAISDDSFEQAMSESSPGVLAQLREHEEAYAQVRNVLERIPQLRPQDALVLADGLRDSGQALGKAMDAGQREANLEIVRCLGAWLRHNQPDRPDRLRMASEAHDYIRGNGYAPIAFDRLSADLLAR